MGGWGDAGPRQLPPARSHSREWYDIHSIIRRTCALSIKKSTIQFQCTAFFHAAVIELMAYILMPPPFHLLGPRPGAYKSNSRDHLAWEDSMCWNVPRISRRRWRVYCRAGALPFVLLHFIVRAAAAAQRPFNGRSTAIQRPFNGRSTAVQ